MADAPAQAPQAFPLSIEDIERLVKSLYDPGNAKKITETEATLRVLQRSPLGWEMGAGLLNSTDENVRFFGALTFTVKLNADSSGLTSEDSQQLLSKLIHHLVSHPTTSLATRKLCSTLALYTCKPISAWSQCIRSLAVSFANRQPVLEDALDDQPSSWDIIPHLSDQQLLVLLEFAMNLADEAKKIPIASVTQKPHDRIIANVDVTEVVLQTSFGRGIKYLSTANNDPNYTQSVELGEKLAIASLKCFTAWIFYAQSFRDIDDKLRHLRSVNELALACLEYHVDDAMELIADLLENYPKFFELHHQAMLWSTITSSWGVEILKNLDAETVALARIIVAYGQILLDSKKLYKEPDDAHHVQVMSVLHELLKYPDTVGIEDEVAPVVLEFWSNYVCTISEESFGYLENEAKPEWLAKATSNVFLVISEFLQKIIYPPSDVTKSWDEETKKTFKVFRIDVRDIIEEAFNILREAVLDQFVDFSIRALEARNWLELEAGLFCLMAISSELAEPADVRLQRLFEQPLFTMMSMDADIPSFTRRTAVETVAAFNSFFLRHPGYLPQVLPFLLSALAQPALAHNAARSFASLCSECRTSLTGELASFFEMYQQFITYPTANESTKSRVLEGIAAIVQAQDSKDKQLAGLQQLFLYVAHDAMQAINVAKEGSDPEQGLVLALTTLKCLESIGKAMQASDEEVIDLATERAPSDYWTQGPGKEIQNQIINFVNYLTQVWPADGEIIEAACNVLRAGFRETVPGPYVLPPSATVNYIVKTNIQTPRLPFVLETACCWLASHRRDKSEEYQLQCQRLLRHVFSLLQSLQHPRNDPEIAVGCIELINKFVTTDARIFTSEQPDVLKGMFDFTIECIRAPEVLPKRASAMLWKDIFEGSGKSNSNQGPCKDIVNHFGPAVTYALVFNICGEVDSSSLEYIMSPLRQSLNSDVSARTNIRDALAEQPLLLRAKEDPALAELIRKFLESVTRNARVNNAFKHTVKEFWERCKLIQMQLAPEAVHPGHRLAHGLSPF